MTEDSKDGKEKAEITLDDSTGECSAPWFGRDTNDFVIEYDPKDGKENETIE